MVYKYVFKSPHPIPRVGRLITGTVQVSRPHSDQDILRLVESMDSNKFNQADYSSYEILLVKEL